MKKFFTLLVVGILLCGCEKDDTGTTVDGVDWNIKCPNNEIVYKTKYGYPIELSVVDGFGGKLQSNTYDGNYGRIVFDDDVKTIPANAFHGCTTLTNVVLPDGVTSIGGGAFGKCSELVSVNVGKSLKSVRASAFFECDKMQKLYGVHVSSDNRCIVIDGVLCVAIIGGLTKYELPHDVETVGDSVFYNNSTLESLTLSDNVTAIGNSAFYKCTNLSNVALSDNVKIIGDSAFYGCAKLQSMPFGNNVEQIGERAFYSCKLLNNIVIPETLTKIGDYALSGCTGTLRVNCNLPNGSDTSGYGLGGKGIFSGTRFTDIIIGDNVSCIGDYAFCSSGKMVNLTIGKSVKEIGDYAFAGADKLEIIYCKPMTPPQLNNRSFDGYSYGIYDDNFKYQGNAWSFEIPNLKAIYVPKSAVATYTKEETWKGVKGYDFGY